MYARPTPDLRRVAHNAAVRLLESGNLHLEWHGAPVEGQRKRCD